MPDSGSSLNSNAKPGGKSAPIVIGEGAFADVVSQHEGPLIRYAARLLGDVERARDVVQDTFLKLCLEDLAELEGRLAQWLYTVCRHRALDVHKKERRVKTFDERAGEMETIEPVDHTLVVERNDEMGRLSTLLARLPERQQEAIRLKFQDSLSYRQISGVMGLSESNVGYLIHTGIKDIRQRLAAKQPSVRPK